jgi:biotin carboxyl carrier protein
MRMEIMKVRVKVDGEIYEVEIADLRARPILASVEGEVFEIWPEEAEAGSIPINQPLLQVTGPQTEKSPAAGSIPVCVEAPRETLGPKKVTAPIPGVVISINVKTGEEVEHGQELLVLEAMKMKNAIRANRSGVVAQVYVAAGDTVSHGQPLLEYAE